MSLVKFNSCIFTFGILASVLLVGCSKQPTATPSAESLSPVPETTSEQSAPKGLAELSEEDREAAIKQDICPVSGEKLGSMGAPPKLVVSGQEVFICCSGCEDTLLAEPDKYLAKLKSE